MEEDDQTQPIVVPLAQKDQRRVTQLESKVKAYEDRFLSMEDQIKGHLKKIDELRKDNRELITQVKDVHVELELTRAEGRKMAELLHIIMLSGVVPHTLIAQILQPHMSPQTPQEDDEDYNEWEDDNG
jgi:septal ring factor EnvC (AmiA/AmiB activator)